ncbi:hypothetical protein G9A89_006902 [Geosiphon pyriformis]|nr:hypothetical protein G9A89_006902 [Geosiphon pyriformis]
MVPPTSVLQKEVGALKLRSGNMHYNISDDEDMDDDDDDDDDDDGDAKDFLVYDDTFDVMMELWEIAQSSGVASVSSPSLSVALHDISLSTSFDDIKTALSIFGVVTSVKLKSAGLWQYAVVNFKDISSAAAALSNWSVLVRKDSIRILPVTNQKKVISLRDVFKAKLVNLPFGCTAFEISDLVSQVGGHTCFIPCSPKSYQR